MNYKPHATEEKKKQVKELTKFLDTEEIVGVVNMENLPAAQLQTIRKSLRGKISLYMIKKRLMKIALEKAKKDGIKELAPYLEGMPALLFSKDNPFSLFKALKKSKSPAPAKAGQKAPRDIVVKAGPTPFAPGPVISELSSFGLKPGVEGGKVSIKEDKVIAKEGTVIDAKLASLLLRLGIEPMEIGLNLVAVYEKGTIYTRKVLDVDEDQILADMQRIAVEGFNLAMEIGFPTSETIQELITKAERDAKALVMECNILTKDHIGDILAKAEAQATTLKNL